MTRIYKRKTIAIMSGDDIVDSVEIPVIAEMSFIGSRGQEFRYRFTNDSTTKLRTVRVKKVGSATGEFGSANVNFDRYVNAERIQSMAFSNSVEMVDEKGKPVLYNQAWRTDKRFKNQDPAPKQPDGSDDPHHLQVHYVRYYKNNDTSEGSSWIDVELIDKIDMLGTNAQEYGFKLNHPPPTGGQTSDDDPYHPKIGFCDPSLDPLPTEYRDENGRPLAARLDPFQNIVNVNTSFLGIGGSANGGANYVFDHFPLIPITGGFPRPEPPYTSWACNRTFCGLGIGVVDSRYFELSPSDNNLSAEDISPNPNAILFNNPLALGPYDSCHSVDPAQPHGACTVTGTTVRAEGWAYAATAQWYWIHGTPLLAGQQVIPGGKTKQVQVSKDYAGLTLKDKRYDPPRIYKCVGIVNVVGQGQPSLTFSLKMELQSS